MKGFSKKISDAEKKQRSLQRAEQLKTQISDYLQEVHRIPTGLSAQAAISVSKQRIVQYFGATEDDWLDWRWQMGHRIKGPEVLALFIKLTPQEIEEIKKVQQRFRWAVSPYYVSLMDTTNDRCPLRRQAIPSGLELEDSEGDTDPMGEELTSPAPCITRRYPDRLIINVTNCCAMYCRHCQRRHNLGTRDLHKSQGDLLAALDYIRSNGEIRDVLITGGDALLLRDDQLDWLLTQLDMIKHVEIKRIGTRTPVTLPQRITPELCEILAKHPPIYLNTQFNHPQEVTPEAARACDLLVKAGVVLGNQAVLLKGINNNPHIMKKLNQELLKIRVRPYYIFQAKDVAGTRHFVTGIQDGIWIMEKLRGYTSGLAIPAYIINAPQGLGKIPLLPENLLSVQDGKIVLKTWEGQIINYQAP